MTTAQAKALLFSVLPPGFSDWFDFSKGSDGDRVLEASAEQLALRVAANVDTVALDSSPLTLTHAALGSWEDVLGISGTATALFGSDISRKAAIISGLRAQARNNLPGLRAILGPLLGYADPTQLQIMEVSRTDLSTALSTVIAPYTGYAFVGGGFLSFSAKVKDGPLVSDAGARLSISNLTVSDFSDVSVTLSGPDVVTKTWSGTQFFNGLHDPVVLFAKEFAGSAIFGIWTFTISSVAGNVSFDGCTLDAEAIGRDAVHGFDGQGAEIFDWAVYVDPALAGVVSPENDAAVRATIARIKPAHTYGGIVKPSATSSGLGAIPDDDNAVPDECVPA